MDPIEVNPQTPQRHAGAKQGFTLIIAGFLPIFAIVSLFPTVPAMIDHFAGDPSASWKVPSLVSAPGISVAVLGLFMGVLIDKYGRRKLLLLSTAFYAVFGAVPFLLEDLNSIYASRVLLGVTEAAMMTTVNTLMADYWPEKQRRNWLALQSIVGPVLGAIVVVSSGYLTDLRWNAAFLIYLAALPLFFAMLAWLYEPKTGITDTAAATPGASKTAFPMAAALQIGVVSLFTAAVFYVFVVNGGLAFREMGIQSSAELGRLTVIPNLFVVVGAAVFWLVGKWPHRFQLALSLAFIGGGLAIIGLAPSLRWMLAGLTVQQIGAGMVIPTLVVWAQTKLPLEHLGRGMGVWSTCLYVGQFISPFAVSALRNQMPTMQSTFVAVGVIGIVGGLVMMVLLRDPKEPLRPQLMP